MISRFAKSTSIPCAMLVVSTDGFSASEGVVSWLCVSRLSHLSSVSGSEGTLHVLATILPSLYQGDAPFFLVIVPFQAVLQFTSKLFALLDTDIRTFAFGRLNHRPRSDLIFRIHCSVTLFRPDLLTRCKVRILYCNTPFQRFGLAEITEYIICGHQFRPLSTKRKTKQEPQRLLSVFET
jgi:hypothetical protein